MHPEDKDLIQRRLLVIPGERLHNAATIKASYRVKEGRERGGRRCREAGFGNGEERQAHSKETSEIK